MNYAEKLCDPRWQKMRLIVLERDAWRCRLCWVTKTTLHVHHPYYMKDVEPWDYAPEVLLTLCADCHAKISPKANAPEADGNPASNDAVPEDEEVLLALFLARHWVWSYVKDNLNPKYLTNAGVRASLVGLIEHGTLFHPLLPELRRRGFPREVIPVETVDLIFSFERRALKAQLEIATIAKRFDECARIAARISAIDQKCGELLRDMDRDYRRKEEERQIVAKHPDQAGAH